MDNHSIDFLFLFFAFTVFLFLSKKFVFPIINDFFAQYKQIIQKTIYAQSDKINELNIEKEIASKELSNIPLELEDLKKEYSDLGKEEISQIIMKKDLNIEILKEQEMNAIKKIENESIALLKQVFLKEVYDSLHEIRGNEFSFSILRKKLKN